MTEESRTVVVLAKAFPPVLGGVETYSEQVARAYLRVGYRVMVLTQTEGELGWHTRPTPDGDLEIWNSGAGSQLAVFRQMLRATRRLRATRSIAAVHSTTWRVGLVGQMVLPKVPRAITIHGREVLNYPVGAKTVMRWVLNRATVVLCVSRATKDVACARVSPTDSANWVVVHNGLSAVPSTARTVRDTTRRVRILCLCRLVPRKNILGAVLAISELKDETRAQIEMRVVGRGPEKEKIKQAISDHNLEDCVEFLGFVPDAEVPHLYKWADVFLHPHSHQGEGEDFEGFGLVIAEAMAHGCAVISGSAGGPLDFVRDGVTGLLVDGNRMDSIGGGIERVVSQPELRESIAAAGRDFALKNFSWDRHVLPVVQIVGGGAR